MDLKSFTQVFVESLLWSEVDYDTEESLDQGYDLLSCTPEVWSTATRDCQDFLNKFGSRIDSDKLRLAAYDFALTRNGHGVGFWDGDWDYMGEDFVKEVDEYCESAGNFNLCAEDGKVHLADHINPVR
jgi:hypothetical protein